jgi:cytochrome bd-type quinol oxidase subunit 2
MRSGPARTQPYALLTGITLVLVCLLHGATFLCLKTTGDTRERSWQAARRVAPSPSLAIFVDLYPNVMVSSANPAYNLIAHNTASGE